MGQRMGRAAVLATVLTACALLLGSATAWAQGIIMSMETADPGDEIEISATLNTGGAGVAGTQNDFSFDADNIPVRRTAAGRPDCRVNPAIGKEATAFSFQPAGCAGNACNRVRALVLSISNTDPIDDGSVLYTCVVDVAETAAGTFPLVLSGTILSSPAGTRVCGTGAADPPCSSDTNGSINAGEPPPPEGPGIRLNRVTAMAGQTVVISATLSTDGSDVAGTQNDFSFDPANIPVGRTAAGRPNCAVNPAIGKEATAFSFQPAGCAPEACTAVRALVLSISNTDPIPDGSVLYTCNIEVAAGAPDGTYPLAVSGVILSSPAGTRVCGTGAADPPCTGNENGAVILGAPQPTPTPTEVVPATPTPTTTVQPPTATPTMDQPPPTPTATIAVGALLAAAINVRAFPNAGFYRIGNEVVFCPTISRDTPVPPQGILTQCQRGAQGTVASAHPAGTLVTPIVSPPGDDDDGCDCRIATRGGDSRKAWMVLLPILALLALRRRHR
jgi:MYXO-CTERM domain-containing protein